MNQTPINRENHRSDIGYRDTMCPVEKVNCNGTIMGKTGAFGTPCSGYQMGVRRKWGMKKNEEFRSLFILEMILEAKISFVTKRGQVGLLEDDEERLLDEFHELETSFDVLDTPCDVVAK
ncbi:hypothetical protein Tco_1532882 [Tanacetum coccineum]